MSNELDQRNNVNPYVLPQTKIDVITMILGGVPIEYLFICSLQVLLNNLMLGAYDEI